MFPFDHVSSLVATREPVKAVTGPERAKVAVRCRRCDNCKRHKMHKWAARACAEQALSHQTWFVTFTLGPQARQELEAETIRRLRFAGIWADERTDDHTAAESFRWAKCEAQKLWKRLRKAGHSLRYLVACEAHKDGTPHLHALVHFPEGPGLSEEFEQINGHRLPVANRIFADAWGHGFTQTWLVEKGDPSRAFYTAKYISKGPQGRLASSQRYGTPKRG